MSSARWSQLRTFEHQDRPNGETQQVVPCFSWCSKDEGGGGGGCLHIGMVRDTLHCISKHAHFYKGNRKHMYLGPRSRTLWPPLTPFRPWQTSLWTRPSWTVWFSECFWPIWASTRLNIRQENTHESPLGKRVSSKGSTSGVASQRRTWDYEWLLHNDATRLLSFRVAMFLARCLHGNEKI